MEKKDLSIALIAAIAITALLVGGVAVGLQVATETTETPANELAQIQFDYLTAAAAATSASTADTQICHVSDDGDPARTISVDESAVDSHIAHGDTLGTCAEAEFASMPAFAPLYPPPPYHWDDCSVSVVPFSTSADIRGMVPEELGLPMGNTLLAFAGTCPDSTLGPCGWGLIMAPVSFNSEGKPMGTFVIAAYISNKLYYVACREVGGCPLKLAEISSAVNGDTVTRSVSRGEVEILNLTVDRQMPMSAEDLFGMFGQFGFGNIINLKLIPSANGESLDVKQITSSPFIDIMQVENIFMGPATLDFTDYEDTSIWQNDPLLSTFPDVQIMNGMGVDFKFDFGIDKGSVMYDFLRPMLE